MALQFVDFVPHMQQRKVPFSTLSLSGNVAGPRYEDFGEVLTRANAWLAAADRSVKLVSCEALDVDGVYCADDEYDDVTHHVTVSARRAAALRMMPAFVRVLRLWIKRNNPDTSGSVDCGGGVSWSVHTRLGCINIVPCRLESTPHAFGPKFQGLSDMMQQFNEKIDRIDDVIPGRILSIQTSVCRFNSKHCSINPNRTFWLTSDLDDVHTCYYVQVFYTTGTAHVDHIGFRDFPPECGATRRQHKTAPAKTETVNALVRRAGAWLDSQAGRKRLVSIQLLDHRLNYEIYNDKPTTDHLRAMLDRPHVVTSLRTTTYHTRVVRVFYTDTSTATPSGGDNRQFPPNCCKIFHVPVSHRVMDNQFVDGHVDRVLANHGEVERRLSRWQHQTHDLEVILLATVKLVTGHDVKQVLSAENCHSVSGQHHINHVVYALVVYTRLADEQRDGRLSPEPKHVRLAHNNCDIL